MNSNTPNPNSQETFYKGDGQNHVTGDVYGGIAQYYNGIWLAQAAESRSLDRVAAPRPMNEQSLKQLKQVFVEPTRFSHSKKVLEGHRAVLITGDPGSGRRSAAMMLLFELAAAWNELPSDFAGDGQWPLAVRAAGEREGMLLDLSASSHEEVQSSLAGVEPLRAALAKSHSLLAVVVPNDIENVLPSELRRLLVRIERPNGREVFSKHLLAEGIDNFVSEAQSTELVRRFHEDRPSELARLAYLVGEAKLAERTQTISGWLTEALDGLGQRGAEVNNWVRKHQRAQDRALLLTAGMLEGASSDAVNAGTNALLETVKFPKDETNILELEGMTDRLANLPVELDAQRRIRFTALNYGHEVRMHFWAEHPYLRGKLREWIGKFASSDSLSPTERQRLVVRFAEQALQSSRPDDLRSVCEQWVRFNTSNFNVKIHCVELALEIGLLDERFGGWFRSRVYDWSTRAKESVLSSQFDLILIRLCGRVIAPSYPDQAIVRLHHFARRDVPFVVERASETLADLTESPSIYRRLLYRLSGEISKRGLLSDLRLFVRTASPEPLLKSRYGGQPIVFDVVIQDLLITSLRVVLDRPKDVWHELVISWLTASSSGPSESVLLALLTEACGGRTALLGRLYQVARSWVLDADSWQQERRSAAFAKFIDQINSSQGLGFLKIS